MTQTQPDLVVIGGGSGGLAAARRASREGAFVVLIERAELGGTCVNRGCVPKKLLWYAARHWAERTGLEEIGAAPTGRLDFAALARQMQTHIDGIRAGFESALDDQHVALLRGTARIEEDLSVTFDGAHLRPDKVLIATGARATRLEIPGADHMIVSDNVFRWTDLPERLTIIGGGYIGCEFAAIFSALGVDVTLVSHSDRLLGGFDAEAVDVATQTLRDRGVALHLNASPREIKAAGGARAVHLDTGETLAADRVLCATGRRPNIDDLGPGAQGLVLGDSGALAVNADFETSRAGLYAIGDAADRLPLTPVATRDGETFAARAFCTDPSARPDPIDLSHVTTTAFMLPALAQVGRPEPDQTGQSQDAMETPLLHPSTDPQDFYKITATDGHLTGAVLIHEAAAEMIAPLAALIAGRARSADLDRPTGVHPSFGEELIGR